MTYFDATRSSQAAASHNPAWQPPPGSNRRVAQSPPHNLLKRLREKRDDVLRFITDLRVLFDKNQAERNIRMPKRQQEVAGGLRTNTGLARFAAIRSYLSTLHSQGADIFGALVPHQP